jgi:hypothetical protein
MNTQSTAVACLRTLKKYSTQKTRSRWLPATRETQVQKGVTKLSGKGTRNLRRELRTGCLAGESTILNVSVVRLLASSALRSQLLSPPIGVVGSNFITSFRQRIGPSWRVRTRQQ